MMNRWKEYQICKVRGHKADPMKGATMNTIYGGVPKYVCRYCGTTFWNITTTTTEEDNPPLPAPERKEEK